MTTEITIRSSREIELRQDINREEAIIKDYEFKKVYYNDLMQKYLEMIQYNDLVMKAISIANIIPTEFDKNILEHWNNTERHNRDLMVYITDYKNRIEGVIANKASYKRALETQYKELESLKLTNKIISINDIKMILIENKNIINDSINFTYIKDSPYLTFVFTGLRCKPDVNPYFNIS